MKFLHEIIDERMKVHLEILDEFRSMKRDADVGRAFSAAYEIAEYWTTQHGEHVDIDIFYVLTLTMFRPKNMSLKALLLELEYIEEEFLSEWGAENMAEGAATVKIKYKKGASSFKLRVENAYCKHVETGKLIPEVITVCGDDQ